MMIIAPRSVGRALATAVAVVALSTPAFAQSAPAATPAAPPQVQASTSASNGVVGMQFRASTLGLGADVAIRVHERVNIRAGMNAFSYSRNFEDTDDNITYVGKASLRSAHAYLDFFPMGGGFHISPGVVLANDNKVSLDATIPGGQKFGIDDTDYISNAANPAKAAGTVSVEKMRPALVIGWGNLIPTSRRYSVSFEIGAVFQGVPTAVLSFTGSACALNGTNCRDVLTDATIQGEVRNQQATLNSDLNKPYLKYYPVLSFGLGFRF